ncbi:hypothetical protein FN846DRAFT_935154 [Sphaerosporella brunnea]|uniref:Rhodopsin domain-containing protein n=1 Tax=Sphaerosporella brunnea TaxID=1250544 RepID=A0A5J5F546_9PEZI|nr:hypothetical protein FN846DRAFT_935154 [Sphaerosporella brunnea]
MNSTMVHTGPEGDKTHSIMSVAIAMTVCVGLIVPARFFVRGFMVGKLGADDWFIAVATVMSIAMNILVMMSTRYGSGHHIWDIPPADFVMALKYNFFTQVITVPCLAIVKDSIALLLLRLAATEFYRRVCIIFITVLSTYSLASTFTVIFQCVPVQAAWDSSVPNQKCMTPAVRVGLSYSYSIIAVISDFFLVLLPIAMLWNAQITRRQRVAICGILSVGAFASSASIVKAHYLTNYGKKGDFLWDSSDITTWTIIELDVGIMSASMPALKPLFKKVIDQTLSYSGSNSRSRATDSHGLPLSNLSKSHKNGASGIRNEICASSYKSRTDTLQDSESEKGIMGINRRTDVRVDIETVSTLSGEAGSPMGVDLEEKGSHQRRHA